MLDSYAGLCECIVSPLPGSVLVVGGGAVQKFPWATQNEGWKKKQMLLLNQ